MGAMRKGSLAYLFHLAIATLAVPMLAVMASALVGPLIAVASAVNPQRFYSDHVLVLAAITGLCLAYFTYETFPSVCALWIWIPSTLGFVARILSWRTEESVLFHPGIIDHFFVAGCQIQNWGEPACASRCSDQLFLTPLVVGSLAYSAGAAIRRASEHRLLGAANFTERAPAGLLLLTTPFRALAAVTLTGGQLAISLHSQMTGRLYSPQWLLSGLFPTWAVITINVLFWSWIFWIGVTIALGALKKDEKTILVAIVGGASLPPVGALPPKITSTVRFVQTSAALVAFLAALAILVSFWSGRVSDATG